MGMTSGIFSNGFGIFRYTQYKKVYRIIFILVLVSIGFYLRFHNITAREFWYDEAFSGIVVRYNWNDMLSKSLQDVHPPAYYIALKAWSGAFGTSELALRSLSLLFGVATIPLVYLLARRLSNETTALVAAILVTFNPFLIAYSQEARSYAMFGFIALVAIYLLVIKQYFLASILILIAFLTHYGFAFGIILLPMLVGLNIKGLIKTFFIPLIGFLLWIPHINLESKLGWVDRARFSYIPQSIYKFLFGVDTHSQGLPSANKIFTLPVDDVSIIIFTFVVVLSTIAVVRKVKGIKLLLILSLVPIVLTAVVSIYFNKHLYVERFLLPYGIVLIVLISLLLIQLPKFIYMPIIIYYIYVTAFISYTGNIGYRELADNIDDIDRTLVMVDILEFGTLKYYLPGESGIKLQEWGLDKQLATIISPGDLVVKEEMKEPFYLVSTGEILGWDYSAKIAGFYLYDWAN